MNELVPLNHDFKEKKFNWKKAGAPVGGALLLLALGWGAGAKIDALRGPSSEQAAAQAAAESADKVLRAEEARQQAIAELRAHVESLKGQLDAQAEKARGSDAAVAALQKSLSEEKAQSQALHSRLEKLQAATAKPQPDRAPMPTVPPPAAAKAAVPPPAAVKAVAPAKPAVAQGPRRYGAYVLRDVNDGVAVIEGMDGVEEAGPGDILQDGARVQRVERRGRGWVVLTDRGYIAPGRGWAD
jgi:hypothetical protein